MADRDGVRPRRSRRIRSAVRGGCADEITPSAVRTWRAERLAATGNTTVAKSYRLLKATMETATDDELIRRNPCRIRGACSEQAKERSTATVARVDELAEAMGPRRRLMVYFCAYGPMRPGTGDPPLTASAGAVGFERHR